MAMSVLRNKMFHSQLRQLHKNVVACSTPNFISVKEKNEFQGVFTEIINSLDTNPKFTEVPEARSWTKQVVEYMVSGNKLTRGLCVGLAYQMLEDPENITEDKLHSARILGWCIEMLQTGSMILDDMLDGSTTRSGKLCWHQQPNVGISAVNDSLLINQFVMEVLETNFDKMPFYTDLLRLFNETNLYTAIGQYLDWASSYNKKKNNINLLTMERYNTFVTYKSSYYSFRTPISLALLLIKNSKQKANKEWTDIFRELTKFLQLKNDYSDVYGDHAVTGKVGSDIQEGRCTWLAVTALQRCNDSQRSVFKEYYGSKDPEHVKRIEQLYEEVHLPSIYKQYESTLYAAVRGQINMLPSEGEKKLFLKLLNACNEMQYEP